jgi:DNA-binding beta-propeller fold protein YncE
MGNLKPRKVALILTIALATMLTTAGCSTQPAQPDTGNADTEHNDIIQDSTTADGDVSQTDAVDADAPDSWLPDTGRDADGLTDDADVNTDADLFDDPGTDLDISPDVSDSDAITDTTLDIPDICPTCPRGICDPETLECRECTKDSHCDTGSYCDSGECRVNLCVPAAMFCVETTLYRCSLNGGGFTIIQDCNDQNPCTVGDACKVNKCVTGETLDCQDDNPCTIDYCTVEGTCDHYGANDIYCDDGNPCTADDHCVLGTCSSGGAKDCSDNNACTLDYCISKAGCIHEPQGGSCNDSSGCTFDDRCIEGRCSGTPQDCNDNNPCTSDSCVAGGCRNVQISGCGRCSDDLDCEDSEFCTLDTCDIISGICNYEPRRSDGCCLDISDCPATPQCILPICGTDHVCAVGSMAQPGCCNPQVRYVDFSAGIPGEYQIDAPVDSVGWRIGTVVPPVDGLTGPAIYFGNQEETTYDNAVTATGSFITDAITMPAQAGLMLSFLTWQDVDPIGGFDTFEITAIVDTRWGPESFKVWKRPADFPMKSTTSVSVDISALSGRTARFKFTFDSGDEISNSGRGVYVDDISVDAECNGVPCSSDTDCISLGMAGFCNGLSCNFTTSWMETAHFGEPGSGAGFFMSPTDLAAIPGPEGAGQQILVSDSRTHYVQVFDQAGTFIRMFGGYGTTPGRFLTPKGIAGSEGRVYIVDSTNSRIQVMTPAGIFLYSFGSAGIDPGQLDTPRGVAISPDGNNVYVADTGNHRISVFSRLGVYQFSFGAYGTTAGRFRTPSSIVTSADGNIWVCDTQNNRLQVFAPNGRFIKVIKPQGVTALSAPAGITRMSDGRIVVADSSNHRLVIFNASGYVSGTLGSFGTGWGQFNFPVDVDVMPMGYEDRLVVADAGNFRITVWAVRLW